MNQYNCALNHFLEVPKCSILCIHRYPSELPAEMPTVTTDQPPTQPVSPTTAPTMAVEVVTVVMNNMENYLPTDAVEQGGNVRYETLDHLLFGRFASI